MKNPVYAGFFAYREQQKNHENKDMIVYKEVNVD